MCVQVSKEGYSVLIDQLKGYSVRKDQIKGLLYTEVKGVIVCV